MGGTEDSASGASTSPSPAERVPFLRVVRGDATPEELAALVAVLAAAGGEPAAAPRRRPEWSAPHRGLRRTLPAGPGGWRSSGLPR